MTQAKKKQDWQNIEDKNIAQIFDIITGKYYYLPQAFSNQDLKPDLVLKWRVPEDELIKRNLFNHVSTFVNLPEEQLQQAYSMAQKRILSEMQKQKQNTDMNEIKLRLQMSLKHIQKDNKSKQVLPKMKASNLILQTDQLQELEFYCVDQKEPILDGFTLYFNSVMYILQKHCGFKVRAFMTHKFEKVIPGFIGMITDMFQLTSLIKKFGLGSQKKVRDIYLYLNLSEENMMKVADRYRIKKSIDQTNFDFSLNDPSTQDERPIKLNRALKVDQKYLTDLKKLSRYFKTYEQIETNAEIMEEVELGLGEEQKFKDYWEEANCILNFFMLNLKDETSNEQKVYIYEINRQKLNPGCQKMFSRAKKRRDYFQLMKKVCEKHDFPFYDEVECYGQFILPSKNSKGGFFQKFNLMLSYNPVYTSPYGHLSLFSSMERTKLCYLQVKSTFKINYLNQIGVDIFAFNNEFQKTGKGGKEQKILGGLNGTFLTQRWNSYALFSDIQLIRSYFGQTIAFEVMLKGKVIIYLLSMSVPYVLLYIFELMYNETVSIQTSLLETGLFALSFGIFTQSLQQQEQRFKLEYEDNRVQRVFLKQFRGPYIRNPVTDQMNEFQPQQGIFSIFKSFVCILMLGILIVIFAYIFYGCRRFHLAIYDPLFPYKFSFFNLSAIISYSIYFLIGDVFKIKFYGFIIRMMIWIKNPPDEYSQQELKSYFTFYYLLSLEFIPILFYYIFEPVSGIECLGNCYDQYLAYVSARFAFNLVFAFIKLFSVIILVIGKKSIQQLSELSDTLNESAIQVQKPVNNFQDKLKQLILNSIKESEKKEYQEELAEVILALFSYSFYNTTLALAGVISFLYICTIYITTRMSLIYETKRPINKSTPIVTFAKYCNTIYFFGLLANVWVNTFLLGYVEKYYIFLYTMAPKPLTRETSFMVRIVATAFFMIIFSVLGLIVRKIATAFSVQTLFKRLRNKYKSYLQNVKRPKSKQNKIQELQPLKTIGRITNPEKMQHEKLKEAIEQMKFQKIQASNLSQDHIDDNFNEHKPGVPADAINGSNARLKNDVI